MKARQLHRSHSWRRLHPACELRKQERQQIDESATELPVDSAGNALGAFVAEEDVGIHPQEAVTELIVDVAALNEFGEPSEEARAFSGESFLLHSTLSRQVTNHVQHVFDDNQVVRLESHVRQTSHTGGQGFDGLRVEVLERSYTHKQSGDFVSLATVYVSNERTLEYMHELKKSVRSELLAVLADEFVEDVKSGQRFLLAALLTQKQAFVELHRLGLPFLHLFIGELLELAALFCDDAPTCFPPHAKRVELSPFLEELSHYSEL